MWTQRRKDGRFWSANDVNGAVNGAEKSVFVVLGSDRLFDARKVESAVELKNCEHGVFV